MPDNHTRIGASLMRIQPACLILIVGLVVGSIDACTAAAAILQTSNQASPAQVLDEFEVKGIPLWELRAAVIKAEDRVVARYNDLNQDDDLDIECQNEAPTGTRFLYRHCRIKLQKRAQEDDSWNWFAHGLSMQPDSYSGVGTQSSLPPLPDTPVRLMERTDDYRKNLVTLLQADPRLRELTKEHGDARRRYEAALQERKSKPTK